MILRAVADPDIIDSVAQNGLERYAQRIRTKTAK